MQVDDTNCGHNPFAKAAEFARINGGGEVWDFVGATFAAKLPFILNADRGRRSA